MSLHRDPPGQRSLWCWRSAAAVAVLAVLGLGCSPPSVEVIAIANEGFLIRSGRRAVIVDGLFRATAPFPDFFQQAPSEALLETMISGGGAFERVDLVLVSHGHGDHFHAPTVSAFLRQHEETILIGNAEVTRALLAEADSARFAHQVEPVDVSEGECCTFRPHGIETTICNVGHSGAVDAANLLYVVTLGSVRFVHEGDADRRPKTFVDLDLGGEAIDLAFLHDWFVFDSDGREILLRTLDPGAVVLMHHRWAAADGTRERLGELPKEVASTLPPVTVFGAETARATIGATHRQ